MASRQISLTFSLRWLFAMLAVCAVLTWYLSLRHKQQHARHIQKANQIADAILLAEHDDRNEVATGAMPVKLNSLRLKSPPAYLLASQRFKNGDVADHYELTLLSDIQSGSASRTTFVRDGPGSAITYYKVIHMTANCRNCHASDKRHVDPHLAIMKISL